MEIVRFALGMRFLPRESPEASAAWAWSEAIAPLLPAGETAGLLLYGGPIEEAGGPRYLAVLNGGKLKQMRRIHRRLESVPEFRAQRAGPYLQSNALARIEGLAYLGQVQEDGTIAGGDAPVPGLRFTGAPIETR